MKDGHRTALLTRATLVAFAILLTAISADTHDGNPPDGDVSSRSSEPIESDLPEARLEVQKANRKLLLYSGDTLLRVYPIGLGFNPIPPKRIQGDGATPEGDYMVCVKNPHSRYYLSLGLNYPNATDAQHAFERKLITKAERNLIIDAARRGTCPPWNTQLGGEIFIHGRGSSSDWTLGCIALDDPEMAELFRVVALGTKVEIKP